MTMKKATLYWILSVSAAVCALGAWRYFAPPNLTAQVALLNDASRSVAKDCASVAAIGSRILGLPNLRAQSALTLFASTDHDPMLIDSFNLPAGRLTTESDHPQEERRKVFLAGLSARCQSMAPTNTSPIFQSVKQVVAHMQANTNDRSVLYLFVRTDLHETAQIAIRKALSDRSAPVDLSTAITPIDNTGIHISFCGYAESSEQDSRAYNPDRLVEVWRTVFTHPELVRFDPYCVKPPARPETQ
jgi:hypothetical protein